MGRTAEAWQGKSPDATRTTGGWLACSPFAFFVRLLQEAHDLYPDYDRTDEGEDWSNPADWVEEHYAEHGPA